MNTIELVKQLYSTHPYPKVSADDKIINKPIDRYRYSVADPYYLTHKRLPSKPLRILDAGCGTGKKTLALAIANPSSEVVGIDFSGQAIALAKDRQQQAGLRQVTFVAMPIERAADLGGVFDYIHCDDTLYLMDNPTARLRALGSLLASDGVLRVTLHNLYGRLNYLRAQTAAQHLGLFELESHEGIAWLRSFFGALQSGVFLREQTWDAQKAEEDEYVLQNHLLVGDKAFTLDEALSMVRAAGLAFVEMGDHLAWTPTSLLDSAHPFYEPALDKVQSLDREAQLKLFYALQFNGRLFDLVCCPTDAMRPSGVTRNGNCVTELHPSMLYEDVVAEARTCAANGTPWAISQYVPYLGPVFLAGAALDLFVILSTQRVWPMSDLLHVWKTLRPTRLLDLRQKDAEEVAEEMQLYLATLEQIHVAYVTVDETQPLA